MKNLIEVEIFKLNKRKIFLFIIIFNTISILYALGIYFGWSWVTFEGKFDLIKYIAVMWQLFFLIGIPMILFMYVGGSIIGTERTEGQILLEVTRVANKLQLILAKFITMLYVILFYFISNIFISALSYLLFVRRTDCASLELIILDKDNKELIISCLAVLLYLILSVFIVMCISVVKSALVSTISGILVYVVLSLAVRINSIQRFVPGYLALTSSANFDIVIIIYQFLICAIISICALLIAQYKFKKMDL